MALSYAQILAEVLQYLSDTGAAIFASAETQYGIENELKHLSRFSPHFVDVIYKIESRTGTATAGTENKLTDTTKSQFVATVSGLQTDSSEKVIHNTTDNTWATTSVATDATTSEITLNADIMDSGEKYEIYNKRCRNNKQIYLGNPTDIRNDAYLWVDSVEYPIGTKRNFKVDGDVLEIDVDSVPDSNLNVTNLPNIDVLVRFAKSHRLCQLTNLLGALLSDGLAGGVAIVADGLTSGEIIEVGDEFHIENHRTLYTCTEQVIAATEGRVLYFYPALEATAPEDDAIYFTKSTLSPAEENFLIRLVSARACISKSTSYYGQVNTAVTTLTNATTAVAAIAARITQAIADLVSGRAEAVKISSILDTANTEIDKIGGKLAEAAVDIAAGRIEANKIPTIVDAAATAISGVAARITQAATDVASGRSAIALGELAISSASVEMGLTDAQVDLAVTALSSGNDLINTIPVAGGAAEYMGQAASDVGAAQGYMLSGQGLLQKSSADFNNASADFGAAAREIASGMAMVSEAQANLSQANTDMGANRTYIDQAVAQIGLARGYFQEAQGYVLESNTRMSNNASYIQTANGELRAGSEKTNEAIANLRLVASRLQVSQGGLRFEEFGRRELAQVESELRGHGGLPSSKRYPRD